MTEFRRYKHPGVLAHPDLKGQPPRWRFGYKNWRGEDHEYVVEVEGVELGPYGPDGQREGQYNWVMHGMVVTRDGSVRRELGDHRRRTFQLEKMRNVEEVK